MKNKMPKVIFSKGCGKIKKTPIELIYILRISPEGIPEVKDIRNMLPLVTPFNYIEILAIDYLPNHDLIFCYDDPEKKYDGCLYLGKVNDGVV